MSRYFHDEAGRWASRGVDWESACAEPGSTSYAGSQVRIRSSVFESRSRTSTVKDARIYGALGRAPFASYKSEAGGTICLNSREK